LDIPSYLVKQGDKITLKAVPKTQKMVKAILENDPNAPLQPWLQVNPALPEGVVVALPTRDDVQIPVEEHLIVEFCSK
jgi:small subunit ribosomal protein S4